MKIKKLPISLLLLICCIFAFSACSKSANFNFDENGAVKLTYTCVDKENNFNAELSVEQSDNFILSLNKINYVEVNEDINFSPSYDRLRINIGNDNLDLYDVGRKINYGGYFYLNGKLCKTEEKFGFLQPYLVDYRPDFIPNNVSFNAQYVKSSVGTKDNYQIIKSVSQLNNYIATETQTIGWPDIVLFKDEEIAKYNDEYFENSFIVIFMKVASSGSFDFKVNNVYMSNDQMIIDYEIVLPSDPNEGVTCDIAYWYSFVELSNVYNSIKTVNAISLKNGD